LPRLEVGKASPSHGEGGLALASRGEPCRRSPLASWTEGGGKKTKEEKGKEKEKRKNNNKFENI